MDKALPVADLGRVFTRAERATGLFERVLPTNLRGETARLIAGFRQGSSAEPAFTYRTASDLAPVQRVLASAIDALDGSDALDRLYRARAHELFLEASMGNAVGTPALRALARRRFPVDALEASRSAGLAEEWLADVPTPAPSTFFSDDPSRPESLLGQVRRLVFEHRIPFRVETRPHLSCFAATGADLIVVREGDRHTEVAARRIALHEVLGHALPRHRASVEPIGLFAAGTATGCEDEEGRAVLLEQRSGLLDAARRRELALRHLMATVLRGGADFVETVRAGLKRGATVEEAVPVAARVHRGGGLAREIAYLPAFLRVRQAFASDPSAERYLERGRVGVDTVAALRQRAV